MLPVAGWRRVRRCGRVRARAGGPACAHPSRARARPWADGQAGPAAQDEKVHPPSVTVFGIHVFKSDTLRAVKPLLVCWSPCVLAARGQLERLRAVRCMWREDGACGLVTGGLRARGGRNIEQRRPHWRPRVRGCDTTRLDVRVVCMRIRRRCNHMCQSYWSCVLLFSGRCRLHEGVR